jgi:hypothetical protein
MIVGATRKNMWECLKGLTRCGYIELDCVASRHEVVVEEMKARGYGHYTPIEQPVVLNEELKGHHVDAFISTKDLCLRCAECRARIGGN